MSGAEAPPQDRPEESLPERGVAGIYGPDGRPQFFGDPVTDRFVSSLMNLASEVWAQQERILTLEAATASSETSPDRDALLKQFIDRVFAPLREDRS